MESVSSRYICYLDSGEELYDHQTDPHECNNLAGHEELADWITKQSAKLGSTM